MEKRTIIKQSTEIRQKLQQRLKDLNLSYTAVVDEASRFGQSNINNSTLSRYFSNIPKNSLTEESILFLCYLYGIAVTVKIDVLEYNEQECIDRLLLVFPDLKKMIKT